MTGEFDFSTESQARRDAAQGVVAEWSGWILPAAPSPGVPWERHGRMPVDDRSDPKGLGIPDPTDHVSEPTMNCALDPLNDRSIPSLDFNGAFRRTATRHPSHGSVRAGPAPSPCPEPFPETRGTVGAAPAEPFRTMISV